jgi:hypothetical protein
MSNLPNGATFRYDITRAVLTATALRGQASFKLNVVKAKPSFGGFRYFTIRDVAADTNNHGV